MNSTIFHEVQKTINKGFEVFPSKIIEKRLHNHEVNYPELEKEIRSLIQYTKNDYFIGDKYHSIFIFGPTGVGKTEIIANIAQSEGCVYHKLELQKVPIEILQGFPYLKEIELGNGKSTVAKLAPSTILPPTNDERVWILHFDEFNKADADKMAAVMNLVTTGELGGSADYDEEEKKSVKYKLPRRTIIIGSGNPKEQDNVENLNIVNSMDNATSERWHRTLTLPYNADSWIESFAIKSFKVFDHVLSSRVPPIILNFILDKTMDDGKKDAAFTIPIIAGSEEGLEIERTTSPRSWTLVGDRMIVDGYYRFKNLSKKELTKYLTAAKNNESDPFDEYFNDPQNQVDLFSEQVYEFGIKGKQIVKDVISRYIYFAENRVLPEDVINNYKQVRAKIKKISEKKGVILYLLLGIGYQIESYEKLDNVERVAINISTFIEDNDIPAEDLVAFIQTIDQSPKEHPHELHDVLYDISEKYKNAFSGYFHTSDKDIQ